MTDAGGTRKRSRSPSPERRSDLLPPRPGVRHVHVPVYGLIIADDEVRSRVDRRFHWPMIVLALLTLPLFAAEVYLAGSISPRWKWVIWAGLAVIWLAFLIEFIIKIAIAECRIEYVRRNWLDVIIIVAPFFRPLSAAARTARVFTLRGVGMKFARYAVTVVIGLEATERLLHRLGVKAQQGRKDTRNMTRQELIDEVASLRRLTDAWEAWHEDYEEDVRKRRSISRPELDECR